MDIKEIIATNLIELRKKHNLTQNEFAEKVNYSDNAVSRWERQEVTPNIETLEQISKIFNIPLLSLLQEKAVEKNDGIEKYEKLKRLSVIIMFVSLAWLIATIGFVYGQIIFNKFYWTLFVWAVPASCLILLAFNKTWGTKLFKFIILSVFIWTLLASFYLQLLSYNLWLIFLLGVPVQVGLASWAFIKPPKNKK